MRGILNDFRSEPKLLEASVKARSSLIGQLDNRQRKKFVPRVLWERCTLARARLQAASPKPLIRPLPQNWECETCYTIPIYGRSQSFAHQALDHHWRRIVFSLRACHF